MFELEGMVGMGACHEGLVPIIQGILGRRHVRHWHFGR